MYFIEANKNVKYYKIIQMSNKYKDGKSFPINEVVTADKEVDLSATEPKEMGGFCVTTYEFIFRWIIRGDTLCEVDIPDDTKIYVTESENGVYITNKILLSNPIKLDDNFALELYKKSKLPEISYFKALAACCIRGYENTAQIVLNEKVNKENINLALQEFENFCKRRDKEFNLNTFELEVVKLIWNELKDRKKKYE